MSLHLSVGRVPRHRAAMTLIELLVTLGIAVILLAIALPVVKMSLEGSRVREASRQLAGFIAQAKGIAVVSGRPAGIGFERDVNNPNACTKIYLMVTPETYSGQSVNSQVAVIPPSSTVNNLISTYNSTYYTGLTPKYQLFDPPPATPPMTTPPPTFNDPGMKSLILPGERFQIQFNSSGSWFYAIRLDNSGVPYYIIFHEPPGSESYDLMVTRSQTPPVVSTDTAPVGVDFEIRRNPRRSDTQTLELPKGTAIDLAFSGDNVYYPPSDPKAGQFRRTSFAAEGTMDAVLIMFQPSGAVQKLYYSQTPFNASGTVHLLMGRIEKVPQPTAAPETLYQQFATLPAAQLRKDLNLYDPENLWISLGHFSGAVTTAENSPSDAATGLPGLPAATAPYAIETARQVAVTHQATKGR